MLRTTLSIFIWPLHGLLARDLSGYHETFLSISTLSDATATVDPCKFSSCVPPAPSLVQRGSNGGLGMLETEGLAFAATPSRSNAPSFELLIVHMVFLAIILALVLLILNLATRGQSQQESHKDAPWMQAHPGGQRVFEGAPRANDEFKIPSRTVNMGTPRQGQAKFEGSPRQQQAKSEGVQGPGASPLSRSVSMQSQGPYPAVSSNAATRVPRLELPVPKVTGPQSIPLGFNLQDCPAWATLGTHSSLDSEGTSYVTSTAFSRPGTLPPGTLLPNTGAISFSQLPSPVFASNSPSLSALGPDLRPHERKSSNSPSPKGTQRSAASTVLPSQPSPAVNLYQPLTAVESNLSSGSYVPHQSPSVSVQQTQHLMMSAGSAARLQQLGLSASFTEDQLMTVAQGTDSPELPQLQPSPGAVQPPPKSWGCDSHLATADVPERPILLQWFPTAASPLASSGGGTQIMEAPAGSMQFGGGNMEVPAGGSMQFAGGSMQFVSASPVRTRSLSPVPSSQSLRAATGRGDATPSFAPPIDPANAVAYAANAVAYAPPGFTQRERRALGQATMRPASNFKGTGTASEADKFNLATPRPGVVPEVSQAAGAAAAMETAKHPPGHLY